MTDDNWHPVADADDIAPEEPIKVQIGDEEIALYNVGGEIHATSNICTHAFASMVDGFQEDDVIECPLHGGRFEIKSGKALCAPVTQDLQTFEVKVEDGKVYVKV